MAVVLEIWTFSFVVILFFAWCMMEFGERTVERSQMSTLQIALLGITLPITAFVLSLVAFVIMPLAVLGFKKAGLSQKVPGIVEKADEVGWIWIRNI